MSCYYYRKAYYRSFWLSPPACGVAEPHGKYSGETRLPLILNNIHRYFFYAALLVALILSYDVVISFKDENGEWGHMGLGTLVLLVNVAADLGLHARLPLLPACRRRPAEALLQAPDPLPRLDAGLEAQRPARALRLAVAVLGGAGRPLRQPARGWRLLRPEILLT